jgi:RimJ/RimL family protein N-acetyltransferase
VRVDIPLPIETERFTIRPLAEDDAVAVHEIWSDPEVMRYIPSAPSASLDESRERLARHMARSPGLWAVTERDTGELVGVCGLVAVEGTGPEIEVAYHVMRRHWRRGVATEAARGCVEAGLAAGLEQVVAFVVPENRASVRVLEKVGMRRDGMASAYGLDLARFVTPQEALA